MSTTPPRQPQRPRPPQRPLQRPGELTGPPPRRASQADPPPGDIVTKQTLLGAVLLTALVSTLLAAFVFAMVIDKGVEGSVGPRGIAGPTGEEGERGGRGRTNRDVTAAGVEKAIKSDPVAVVDALEEAVGGSLSGGVATDDGTTDDLSDPDTDSTSTSELDDLRDEIQQVCDALRSSGNVTTDDLPC